MKRVVILSGAGISAESGLATFRDSGGLWEGHDVTAVASPEGWAKNPGMVLKFYNDRRKNALDAIPTNLPSSSIKYAHKRSIDVAAVSIEC